ncbi:MAG: tRNA (guanosine(46)-N7)-methyltransferase TrmB [Ruminococcaceae bacterium]|nr:tRNA (guanosine(46)-N7)-methyltransferase TrmB [Oscillospiraceae bacterium]
MRMRRKKHREDRIENCREYLAGNVDDFRNDFKSIFDNKDNEIHIEIGCGKGKFICEMAERNPHINYIAIEKNLDVLVLAMEKVKEKGLNNVKFVPGDANFLNDAEPKDKCDRIYINFCDPWKKTYQAKRRLTHERFLSIYSKILKSGGEIHFKTDNKDLFEFSLNSFSDYGLRLKNITLDLHQSKFEGNVMTEYETLFSGQGMPIYRCEAIFK